MWDLEMVAGRGKQNQSGGSDVRYRGAESRDGG